MSRCSYCVAVGVRGESATAPRRRTRQRRFSPARDIEIGTEGGQPLERREPVALDA